MKPTEKDLKEYLRTKHSFAGATVKKIASGHAHHNFSVTHREKHYILRVHRTDVPVPNRLPNEYHTYAFLEKSGVAFTPRTIFYDADAAIHLTTFVPGEDVVLNDLPEQLVDVFASQLATIHAFDAETVNTFMRKHGFPGRNVGTPLDSLNAYGFGRFRSIEKHCPDRSFVTWIAPRLEENRKRAANIALDRAYMTHGDIGENIRRKGQKLWFIDWELSGLAYNPEVELGYAIIRGKCSEEKVEMLIYAYARHTKKSIDYLREALDRDGRITGVNDVIWAVGRYTEMLRQGQEGWEKYKKLAQERVADYEKRFEG